MGLKDMIENLKKEVKVVQGEETKDKVYSNHKEFPDEATALKEFERSKQKLFDVNLWSNLKGFSSEFHLYDERGQRTTAKQPDEGYYLKIVLPASSLENWVRIKGIRIEDNLAEFVVHPSEKPTIADNDKEIKHFFIKEASSTFRVVREGNVLHAYEIGKNEGINNQGEEAGDRALVNTLVAEGGWAVVQGLQWDSLTRYLVHLDEAEITD